MEVLVRRPGCPFMFHGERLTNFWQCVKDMTHWRNTDVMLELKEGYSERDSGHCCLFRGRIDGDVILLSLWVASRRHVQYDHHMTNNVAH